METRSNYAIVGAVVIALVIAMFGAALWLSRYSGGPEKNYDIMFEQAVNGLAVGSPVAFNGVPVGKITEIRLMPKSPKLVRVRVSIEDEVPILQGTTAVIEGVGFTGVSQIELIGATEDAPPITAIGPYGVPVIPATSGGLGALLASAPELLKNVSLVAKRLADVLDEDNKDSLTAILANLAKLSGTLADNGPQIAQTLTETRATLQAATGALKQVEAVAGSTDRFLREDAGPLAADLSQTLKSANASLAQIEKITAAATPGVTELSTETIPEASQLLREIRALTAELSVIATRLEEDPAGAISGGKQLPSYKPKKARP
jgi:phospholipid/cholesterol/gamma-HCH transport system substrate-binding protein